jgi:hypothetical protein
LAAYTPDEVRLLRRLTGFGMTDCRRAFETAGQFGGDVVAALAAIHRGGLALLVKADRDAWNRSGAADQARLWRDALPGLAEAFPARIDEASRLPGNATEPPPRAPRCG